MKQVHIEGLGPVTIKKNKRSKRLRATVKPTGELFTSIPNFVSYKEAIKFLYREKENLNKLQLNVRKKRKQLESFLINTSYKTKFHRFTIHHHTEDNCQLYPVSDDRYQIVLPQTSDIKSDQIQALLRKMVREIYRYEAKTYIIPRTIMFAKKHNLYFNKIFIKNTKTRWGSCSSKNNINLNLNLMRLPDDLIDYVILHELSHLKHQHHGKAFWRFLAQLINSPKQLDAQLKQYPLALLAT